MTCYEEENSQLLTDLIENYCLRHNDLELIITPSCDQHCEYCYFQQNRKYLYSEDINNFDTILSNLRILFQYLRDKNCHFEKLSLFSGEIWTGFGLTFLKELLKLYNEYHYSDKIIIPSNMNFLNNERAAQEMEQIIQDFHKIRVSLVFSASIDGKILDDIYRGQNNNTTHSKEFYDKVFKFCAQHNYGLHPMIYSKNAKDWIKNHQWFMSQYDKYNLNKFRLMSLEVRNDDWTQEDIDAYLQFLDYLVDFRFNELYHQDKEQFALDCIAIAPESLQYHYNTCFKLKNHRISCTIQHSLFVRLGDLAIVPCHRTAYDPLVYGNFIVENQIITGIHAKNVELANYIYSMNPSVSMLKCSSCAYSPLCDKGCLGAQLERNHDLFLPCASVCEMEKAKLKFLILKYDKMGILDILSKSTSSCARNILRVIKDIRQKEGF